MAQLLLRTPLLVALVAFSVTTTLTHAAPMPFEVTCSRDGHVAVSICDMDVDKYKESPSSSPMFREQVSKYCRAKSEAVPLDELALMMAKQGVPPAKPAGMIFHMTRCGSTLISNMLATVPGVTMLTESQPPSQILQCQLPRARTIEALRVVVQAMGAYSNGKNVVLKLQSAHTTHADILQAAFPDTPVVFVFRDPVEVAASNLVGSASRRSGTSASFNANRGSLAPCTRSKMRPPVGFTEVTGMAPAQIKMASHEEYCAAYLSFLMTRGTQALERAQNGLALDYTSLPTSVATTVAPFFGIELDAASKARLLQEGDVYSKARKHTGQKFKSDSSAKQKAVTDKTREHVVKYTSEAFQRLQALAGTLTPEPVSSAAATPGGVGQYSVAESDDSSDYPTFFPLGEILDWWNPDIPHEPKDVDRYNSLARFDYSDKRQRDLAEQFRNAELPFIVYNIPSLEAARRRWTDDYLASQLSRKHGVETSPDNHFMYYNKGAARSQLPKSLRSWNKPTKETFMTYTEWLGHAERRPLSNNDTHYYFRASSGSRRTRFIDRDLKYFDAGKPDSKLFIVDETRQRGIHCRFGMQGIIAESHYDGGRNYVSMIRGAKRYILQPPSQCRNLKMLQYPHPSARHSAVDWSNRYVPYARHYNEDNVADAAFDNAASINVVIRAGEAMYIPSFWFHYIVSLDTNIQCNSRSGTPAVAVPHIEKCGFAVHADTSGAKEAQKLRATFRSAFADFNRATPAARYASRAGDAAAGAGGSGTLASGAAPEARPASAGPMSEAEIRRSATDGIGADLVSDRAKRIAGSPHVRRSGFLRHVAAVDWVFTGIIGCAVCVMGGFVFVRYRRAAFVYGGGSV